MPALPPALPTNPLPKESPWAGVGWSLLIPGAGQFVTGRKVQAVVWFIGLYAVLALYGWSLAARALPGFAAAAVLGVLLVLLWLVMLGTAYRTASAPRGIKLLLLIVVCIAEILLGCWIVTYLARPLRVVTSGMAPTLQAKPRLESGEETRGDRIFVERTAYWFGKPQRGDIIAFRTDGIESMVPEQQHQIYLKRIVGLPGDRVSIQNGRLMNHGKLVEQPVVFANLSYEPIPYRAASLNYLQREGDAFEVPEGGYFVIGDNSTDSYDSRSWGPVPARNLLGRISKIASPSERAGSIE